MNKIPQKQDVFAGSVWLGNTLLVLLIFMKTSIFKWNTSPRLDFPVGVDFSGDSQTGVVVLYL